MLGVVSAIVIYGIAYFFELPTKTAILIYLVLMVAYVFLDARFSKLERDIGGQGDSETLAEKIDRSLDEKLTRVHDSILERSSQAIEPTVNRVAELAWMYKKDHPRLDNEDEEANL